jgi:hypothetical protein
VRFKFDVFSVLYLCTSTYSSSDLHVFWCLVWCSPEDGPRWLKHVVNVIIRKVYLVAIEAKYLCFISYIQTFILKTNTGQKNRFMNLLYKEMGTCTKLT